MSLFAQKFAEIQGGRHGTPEDAQPKPKAFSFGVQHVKGLQPSGKRNFTVARKMSRIEENGKSRQLKKRPSALKVKKLSSRGSKTRDSLISSKTRDNLIASKTRDNLN
jgi:hypothetical protein